MTERGGRGPALAAAGVAMLLGLGGPGPARAAAAKTPKAEVVAGVPAVRGALDPAAVRKALKKGVPGLRPCFQEELAASPGAAGVGLLHVRLDERGEVMMSTLLGPVVPAKGAPLVSCVREKVAGWKVAGVKAPGLGFRVALTFGTDELKKKGPVRAAAEARTTSDALPPAGSIAPAPAPAPGEEAGAAPEGYLLPAEVIPAGSGDDGWVLEAEEVAAAPAPEKPKDEKPPPDGAAEPAPAPAPAPRKSSVEIVNVRSGAGLDKLEVELVVKARLEEAKKCWAAAAGADPALAAGQLVLSLHVVPEKRGGRGKVFSVASVTREIGEAALGCIEKAAAAWSFPGPAGAPKSVVTVTLKFTAE